MNPPIRNRLTASGVRPATVVAAGVPAISSHAGASSARNAATTQCDRAGHDVAVHRPVLSGEIEESQDAGARIACDIRSRRSEGDGERVRDGVVAVPEVLVEDLATDLGASDDVADRQLVDRTLVCQRERRVPKLGADAFGAGIDTVCACCHIRSVD